MTTVPAEHRALSTLGRLRRWRRPLEAAVALAGALALVALVFSPQAETFCGRHQVGCGLVTGFVSTALILLAGYFFLFSWTLRRASRAYLDVARRSPERLFATPPRLRAAPAARTELATAVAREVAFARRGAPVVIVGEAGSGKSTFLLELVHRLTADDAVPVLVPLRGAAAPLDLRSLAREEFVRRLDPVVRSEGDAQRIWRRLAAEGALVVLADGLDEVVPDATRHERDYVIRSALVAARNDRLPIVITSRPEAVPPGAPVSQFELGDLEEDEALRYVLDSVHLRASGDGERIRAILRAGRITHTPFYLNVVGSLYRAGRLPELDGRSRDALLVALLDGWTELIHDERFLQETELEASRRRAIVVGLGAVAYALTLDSSVEAPLARVAEVARGAAAAAGAAAHDLPMVVEGAARLELVRATSLAGDIGVRFNHAISQAYLTARLLSEVPEAWRPLVAGTTSAEMRDAIVMWCARDGSDAPAADVSAALVERAEALGDDRALALAVTAAEVASNAGEAEAAAAAASAALEAWRRSTARGRAAAVRRLHGRTEEWAYRALHDATRDRAYRVRWGAARALVDGAGPAFTAIRPGVGTILGRAEAEPAGTWPQPFTHDLSVLGWILPALRATVEPGERDAVDEAVGRLTALLRAGLPLGAEASVAQGFKLGAFVRAEAGVAAEALALAEDCRFWYSRIVLLHAACAAAVARPGDRREVAARLRAVERDDGGHPFVCEAARLCRRALASPPEWRRFVWDDENAAIRSSGSMLAPEAATLLGDVVLLLNVTEQGGEEEREARKEATFHRRDLPHCLSASRDRRELFDGCTCEFRLCPYPSVAELGLARGELSQAFCRHRIETLSALSRLQRLWQRGGAGRWSSARGAALARFWAELERRAA